MESQDKMAKKLFVGNIAWKVSNDDLKDLFSQAGTVTSAMVMVNKMTGKSRGFGFVEFENDAEAESAVEMFNGKDLEGRALVVNEARPMTDRPPRRDFHSRGDSRGGYGQD